MLLDEYRNEIDTIDEQILKLFEARMEVVKKVSIYKEKNNLPVLNKDREEQVIKKINENIKNCEIINEASELFVYIMNLSKQYEHKIMSKNSLISILNINKAVKIGYFGCEGSYTHQASKEFSRDGHLLGYSTFRELFSALKNDEINYICAPIENSSTGIISEVYDTLAESNLYICGENYCKIDHNLITYNQTDMQKIDEIFSHEQGFLQCSDFLSKYPKIKCTKHNSTGDSVALIKNLKSEHKAAIGSDFSANYYGLKILHANINNWNLNYTRFVLISKSLINDKLFNKISIKLSLPHKIGSLYESLTFFKERNISLEKIESRPNLKTPFEYNFYVDFIGNIDNENIINMLNSFKKSEITYKLLGCYKSTPITQ